MHYLKVIDFKPCIILQILLTQTGAKPAFRLVVGLANFHFHTILKLACMTGMH